VTGLGGGGERVTGVRYSQAQTWVVLRERLGWSRQRPTRRAVERDEEAIAAWVKKDWPRIKITPGAAAPG
jgi:transposase